MIQLAEWYCHLLHWTASVFNMDTNALQDAIEMYPKLKHLYRSSDNTIHITQEGAQAQALHLPESSIEKIICKTGKITILNYSQPY